MTRMANGLAGGDSGSRSTRSRARSGLTATVALAAGVTVLAGCATAPRGQSEENSMEYVEIVAALEAAGPTLAAGSDEERLALERFQDLLADFKASDFEERIRDVYAEDAWFNDTLKTLRGSDEIEAYLVATAGQIDKGIVEFLDVVSENGNYYFRWQMTLRFKRFARGEEKRSIGMTHVRFDRDGKVVLHQDFWDSTGGLFEHVPGLGWILRRAKGRL